MKNQKYLPIIIAFIAFLFLIVGGTAYYLSNIVLDKFEYIDKSLPPIDSTKYAKDTLLYKNLPK